MCIATLFTRVKTWKELLCVSTDRQMDEENVLYIHIHTYTHRHRDRERNYYSALKKKRILPLLGIYPKNAAATFEKDRFTPMFITALFTIGWLSVHE